MNSPQYREQVNQLCEAKSRSYAQPAIIDKISLPGYSGPALQKGLSEYSITGYKKEKNTDWLQGRDDQLYYKE